MSAADVQPPNQRGDALLAELKWVHNMIRADLDTVRRMADKVLAGLPPREVSAGVRNLAVGSPLWSLRTNCLYFCRFVHNHHTGESHLLFPAVRMAGPAMAPVVDRLEADHAAVAGLLREIEAASDELVEADTPAARQRVVNALSALSDHLLVHLAYEEEQLGPVLRSWDSWPFGG